MRLRSPLTDSENNAALYPQLAAATVRGERKGVKTLIDLSS